MGVVAKLTDELDQSPKIISNWRDAWRMHSVQASAVGILFNAAAAAAAQSLAATTLVGVLPITIVLLIGAVLFGLGMVGRILVQPRIVGKIDDSDRAGA